MCNELTMFPVLYLANRITGVSRGPGISAPECLISTQVVISKHLIGHALIDVPYHDSDRLESTTQVT